MTAALDGGGRMMPCPACHHDEHDPGSCPDCPRCELHVDEALLWVSRVSREDYDEFIESVEADAIKSAVEAIGPLQSVLDDVVEAARRWAQADDVLMQLAEVEFVTDQTREDEVGEAQEAWYDATDALHAALAALDTGRVDLKEAEDA